MKQRKLLAVLAAALLLAGCGTAPQPQILSEAEAKAFAEQVDGKTANILTALSNHDLAGYTRDMDAQMKQASEPRFEESFQVIIGTIGKYVSHQMVRVEVNGQYRAAVYDARFEKEEHVTVRVVYSLAESEPKISGLWFDSPKLRGQ